MDVAMQIIEGDEAVREHIAAAIDKYGHTPDHHLGWFICTAVPDTYVPVALEFSNGCTIMAYREPTQWTLISEPLAPEEQKAECLVVATSALLTDPTYKKIVVELTPQTKRAFQKALPSSFRMRSIYYTLNWPCMRMETFDVTLPGKQWKTIRKERNGFYAAHDVKVVPAADVPKADLRALVDTWTAKRPPRDHTWNAVYYNFVEQGFPGMVSARAFLVNGKAEGLNAGWMVPNSDVYYGAVGLHTYAYDDLGDMVYLEDLVWMKEQGYQNIDLGGIEKSASGFKRKFLPTSWYKTHVFSIVRSEKV